MTTLTIDLWGDVVCPYCALGSRQLDEALARFDHRDQVEVRRHAFELDPSSPAHSTVGMVEMLVKKFGADPDQVRGSLARLTAEAAALGLTWDMEGAQLANSFDAHRLIALARAQGRDRATSERLYDAYFARRELISDRDQLTAIAAETGVEGVDRLWASDDYVDEVRADERRAHELGITGVPALVVDDRYLVTGARGTEATLRMLERVWEERAA